MTERRRIPPVLRQQLFLRSGGRCEHGCGRSIDLETFHVAHLRAVAHGGATVLANLEAWCSTCNHAQGATDVSDTRWPPRGWHVEGLTDPINIPQRIVDNGIATIAAAPGGGKTVFAGYVIRELLDRGVIDRVVIFVPREPLIEQWKHALYEACHLDLDAGQTHERRGTMGTILTYQSLNASSVGVHLTLAREARTLIVFDEVHHLGEPVRGQRPGWARQAMDITGEIGALKVGGVLNLSGTLWRSRPGQRIPTVRYEPEADGTVTSLVDLDVPAARLIREGLLRPVDLFRVGATVEVVGPATRYVGPIADLEDEGPGRAILAQLTHDQAWREAFVEAIIERLKRRYDDLNRAPVKALIVAASQVQARAFQETAIAYMRAQGLQPFSELAISEDPDAGKILRRFKQQQRPGVLVTVDMAGEGYDCPDIIVIGYASNKLTPLYIRQVVARAQRVTNRERELQRVLPAAVILPGVPLLVEYMANILEPVRHEVETERPDDRLPIGGMPPGGPTSPLYGLESVSDIHDGNARVTGVEDGEVAMADVRGLEPHLRDLQLPVSSAPRLLVAARAWARTKRDATPFEPIAVEDRTLADAVAPGPAHAGRRERIAPSESAKQLQEALARLDRWWVIKGDTAISDFASMANRAGGIPLKNGRNQASLEALRRAYRWARTRIEEHCQATGQPRPPMLYDV